MQSSQHYDGQATRDILILWDYEGYLKQWLLYSKQVLSWTFLGFLHRFYSILREKMHKVMDDYNLADINTILLP